MKAFCIGIFTVSCIMLSVAPLRGQDKKAEEQTHQPVRSEMELTPSRIIEKKTPFYAGAKVGALFLFGVEINCIIRNKDHKIGYLAAAAQTSLLLSSLNAGGGIIFGKTGIGIGCRYHHLLWFEKEGNEQIQPAVGPEIVWKNAMGSSQRIMVNLQAGMAISKTSLFPDISIGLFLPLR